MAQSNASDGLAYSHQHAFDLGRHTLISILPNMALDCIRLFAIKSDAILYSSAAMAILALGMMVGQQIQKWNPRWWPIRKFSRRVLAYSPSRIAFLYFAFFPIAKIINVIGNSLPGLSQPAYAFGLLRFAIIYWLAITVFTSNRNYIWLVVILIVEIVIGSTGFFSSYKEGFFVVLIALAESKRRLPARQVSLRLGGKHFDHLHVAHLDGSEERL